MERVPERGPMPAEVTIFGQEAYFNHHGNGFDVECYWEAELFPFRGVIEAIAGCYQWRLNLHSSFHSRGMLGKGVEREFRWAKHQLEECAKKYFDSMRWFVESNGMRWFQEEL